MHCLNRTCKRSCEGESHTGTTRTVDRANRIVIAVGEHVVTYQSLAGGDEGVGVDEAADSGVVITALEVIKTRFSIVYITATQKMRDWNCVENESVSTCFYILPQFTYNCKVKKGEPVPEEAKAVIEQCYPFLQIYSVPLTGFNTKDCKKCDIFDNRYTLAR